MHPALPARARCGTPAGAPPLPPPPLHHPHQRWLSDRPLGTPCGRGLPQKAQVGEKVLRGTHFAVGADGRAQELPRAAPAVHPQHAQDLQEAQAAQGGGQHIALVSHGNHRHRGDQHEDVWGRGQRGGGGEGEEGQANAMESPQALGTAPEHGCLPKATGPDGHRRVGTGCGPVRLQPSFSIPGKGFPEAPQGDRVTRRPRGVRGMPRSWRGSLKLRRG